MDRDPRRLKKLDDSIGRLGLRNVATVSADLTGSGIDLGDPQGLLGSPIVIGGGLFVGRRIVSRRQQPLDLDLSCLPLGPGTGDPFASLPHQSRFDIKGVVCPHSAGQDAGTVLDGKPRGIPIAATVKELIGGPAHEARYAILGVATGGGMIPTSLRADILARYDTDASTHRVPRAAPSAPTYIELEGASS